MASANAGADDAGFFATLSQVDDGGTPGPKPGREARRLFNAFIAEAPLGTTLSPEGAVRLAEKMEQEKLDGALLLGELIDEGWVMRTGHGLAVGL